MPDCPTIFSALQGLVVGLLLAGLLLVRRPLHLNLLAIALSFVLLLLLWAHGWADLRGRVLKTGLSLHAPWLAFALIGHIRRSAFADALAGAGNWLYAGFYLAVGIASFRNATPLGPGLALGVALFGLMLLVVPVVAERRRRA